MSETAYNPEPTTSQPAMQERLAHCAKLLGGKRALAKASGLSEAQLFRYLGGESDMAVSRLQAIAAAAKVSPAWLLTGEDVLPPPPRPDFHPATMAQVVQTLEEYLLEYPVKFTPKQKGQMFALVYEALRHDQHHFNMSPQWEREQVFNFLDFLSALKRNDEIELYHRMFERLEVQKNPLTAQESLTLDRIVSAGNAGIYNGMSGHMYFDRVGKISPELLQSMLSLCQLVKPQANQKLKWLDLGCGKGNFMLPLAQYRPDIDVHGCDSSNIVSEQIQQLIQSGRLANDCFEKCDFRALPYRNESFDIVYSRYSLKFLPYLPSADIGLRSAIQEVSRILKPGGIFHLITPQGNGRSWLMFRQYVTDNEIRQLLQEHGLGIVNHRFVEKSKLYRHPVNEKEDFIPNFRDSIHVITARKL